MNVLIVDDDRSLCDALRDVLIEAGYSVDCVQDAARACERLERAAFDLVISDWTLPGSGRAVVSHVRRRQPEVPVIILTAHAEYDDADGDEGALSAADTSPPVVARIAKPVEARVLMATVRDVTKGTPLQRRRAVGES